MPFPILAAAAAVPAAFQFIQGLKQTRQADRIGLDRPAMQVSQATQQATGVAQSLANSQMAGYGTALGNIRQNTAGTISAAQQAGSPNNVLGVIAAAGANENNAVNNLDTQNAKFHQAGQQFLVGQLNHQAGEEQRVWDWNNRQKYLEAAGAKSALLQAGAQNTNNGLGGLASAVGMGARSFMGGTGMGTVAGQPATTWQQAQMADDGNGFGSQFN